MVMPYYLITSWFIMLFSRDTIAFISFLNSNCYFLREIKNFMPNIIPPPETSETTSDAPKIGDLMSTQGAVANIAHKTGSPIHNPRTHMEEVTFRYRKISWAHEVAGTEGEDSWDGAE